MPALAIPAAIDVLIIALLGALLIWASRPLWRPLLQAMAQVNFVGAYIAGRIEVLVTASVNAGIAWARAGIAPLALFIHDVRVGLFFSFDALTHATQSLYYALIRVYTVALPALERRVIGYAQHLYNLALAYAQALYQAALAYAQALYQAALAYAQQLYQAALAYAQALYQAALAYAQALYQAALSYAQSLYQAALAYAGQLYAQALAYAQALYSQAIGFAEDAFGRAIDYDRRLFGDLVGLLDREFVLVRDYARALFDAQTLYTDASIARVLARVLRIERSKCQRYCEPLGDLGQSLQELQELGVAALFLGLAADMARDPQGTARMLEGTLSSSLRETLNVAKSEAGIGRSA